MDSGLPRTIAESFPVTVRWNRKLFEGQTRHISARGISVTLQEAIPAGQTLAAWISDETIKDFPSDGIVQWVRRLPFWSRTGAQWEVGIRFLMWSDPYFRFLEQFIREHVERRKHQRYEDELKIVMGSDRQKTDELTRNISRGGMLLESSRQVEAGEEVLIGLTIPDMLDQVQVWGEVVHCKPNDDGTFRVSIRIVAFDHDDNLTYERYVDYLRSLYQFEDLPDRPAVT